MKNKYIIFFASILLFASCNSELDKEPILQTTGSNIFSDKSKIEQNLLGVYSKSKEILALRTHVFIEARGDDFINISANTNEAYASYEMNVGTGTLDNADTWTGVYAAINEANTFLQNLENAKAVAGNDYEQYVSEAKFVRALSYYYLNALYATPYSLNTNAKSVPLRLNAENAITSNNLARSTNSEVYTQILSDLSDERLQYLPDHLNDYNSVTRATKDAARMLRMRVYMEKQEWQKAIDEGEQIQSFFLVSDIKTLFSSPYISSENIFSFPMAETNRGTTQSAFAYYLYDGSRFVLDDTSGIYANAAYTLSDDQRYSQLTSRIGGQLISTKYPDYQTYLDWIPVFRFAETELNLAEAYYQLDNETNAKKILTSVRRRSVPQDADVLDIDALTGTDLLEAIDNERRTEFVGEAIRSLDIHRRGETYYKQKGTNKAITITPTTNGYTWPIPLVERTNNKLIED